MTMNFFAVNDRILAVCGRHNVHVYPLSFLPAMSMLPLELMRNLPHGSKAVPEKLSAVCCDISHDGKYVVAADSGKNIFLFEYSGSVWELFASWEMERRVVKVQFDRRTTFVIMTDKTGDIWLSYMSLKTVSIPKRAMGHTSFVLDVILTDDNKKIITCDRDEKIRISKFPETHEILDFKLGHKEAVINIALVNYDHQLLSISCEGTLKMWHMLENKLMKTWNVFSFLRPEQERTHESEVLRMKATEAQGRIYVSVIISAFSELPVFEINTIDKSIRQFGQVRQETDFTDMCWVKNALFVFNPESGSLKKYCVSDSGLVCDHDFGVPAIPSAKKDWKSFADYNRPFFPLKKRVPSEVLSTIEDARQKILEEFGPLSEEEPEPKMTFKLQPSASEQFKAHKKLVALSKDVRYPEPAVIAAHMEKEEEEHRLQRASTVAGPSNKNPDGTLGITELNDLVHSDTKIPVVSKNENENTIIVAPLVMQVISTEQENAPSPSFTTESKLHNEMVPGSTTETSKPNVTAVPVTNPVTSKETAPPDESKSDSTQ